MILNYILLLLFDTLFLEYKFKLFFTKNLYKNKSFCIERLRNLSVLSPGVIIFLLVNVKCCIRTTILSVFNNNSSCIFSE